VFDQQIVSQPDVELLSPVCDNIAQMQCIMLPCVGGGGGGTGGESK